MTIAPTSGFRYSKFIVSPTAGLGNYTTIQSAINAASAGDTIFIRGGTYTENLTMVPGVRLTAFSQQPAYGEVTIVGKMTFTTEGNYEISNLTFNTNSDYIISCTGTNAIGIFPQNCYFLGTNNTIVNYTNSNASSSIAFDKCSLDVSTTGITLFTSSSAGSISFAFGGLGNSGNSTTASTISAGNLGLYYTGVAMPISSSGSTATLSSYYCNYNCNAVNTACLTWNSTAAGSFVRHAFLGSGSASAISIGSGATLYVDLCEIFSSNTNAITGAGTLQRGSLTLSNSSTINTTTVTQIKSLPKVAPTVQTFTSGSSATYTTPANCQWIRIRMIGGGGGGGGSGSSASGGAGGNGKASTWSGGSLSAGGGTGSAAGGANNPTPGGAASGGNVLNITGGSGGPRWAAASTPGGYGGNGVYGGGGQSGEANGGAAGNGSAPGAGGGAPGATATTAISPTGGGAGGYVEHIILNPAASYTYTVGVGGTGGTAGTSGLAGGNGANGQIIVEEYYL